VPFTSRRQHEAGLAFPAVRCWPNFVCEACTVRSVADRELTDVLDWKLLCYERMRVIDMAHYWAPRTHLSYQQKLGSIRKFELLHGVLILRSTPLAHPPSGPDVPLNWFQEAYSLRKSSRRRDADVNVAFATIRQFRSAVSQFLTWDAVIAHPDRAYFDQNKRLLYQSCRPTDNLASSLFSVGLSARIGDEPMPSVALLDRHVRWLDRDLDIRFRASRDPAERRELACAGLANLTFWLGWLRSSEAFSVDWDNITVYEPLDSASVDLPPNCGAVIFKMLPETKSARSHRVDVVMSYRTLSGFNLGKWVHRTSTCSLVDGVHPHSRVFTHSNGTVWDSRYFRRQYLYPALYAQRLEGDAFLRAFDGSPGNSIEDKLWSMHCYRRGARTQVTRGGSIARYRFRKASDSQIYEHARWRRKRSGEKIDILYREWPLIDRVRITLYSQ
jgi:hypothetical protein